jgi:hypothetical protein
LVHCSIGLFLSLFAARLGGRSTLGLLFSLLCFRLRFLRSLAGSCLSRSSGFLFLFALFLCLTLTLFCPLAQCFLALEVLVLGSLLLGSGFAGRELFLVGLKKRVQLADVLVLKGRAGTRFHIDLVLLGDKEDILALKIVTFCEFVNPHSDPFRLPGHIPRYRVPCRAEYFSLDDDGGQSRGCGRIFPAPESGDTTRRLLPFRLQPVHESDCRYFQRSYEGLPAAL